MRHPNFVTWLWRAPDGGSTMYGAKKAFTADHVNRMASMIRRNWPGFTGRILCVTDMPEGISNQVEIVPIWPDLRQYGKCYLRLRAFDPAVIPQLGDDIVSIDLDAVVMGPLAPLFDGDEPFKIWRLGREGGSEYCGSLWRLKIGWRPEIFHGFDPSIALNLRKTHKLIGSDQAWMAYCIKDAPGWTTRDGILSFRLHLGPKGQMPFFGAKRRAFARAQLSADELLEQARIVFFHGPDNDPSMTHLHVQHPFISEHWR